MSSSVVFYQGIPSFRDPSGVSDPKNYHDVPKDWIVFLADIQGSTKAIEAGRYKEVNLVGVAAITAVKNSCRGLVVPFVFGGDGATFIVPPEFSERTREALLGTRMMAQTEFEMNLRIAEVPLGDPALANQFLRVGKYQVSEDLELAVFSGGALGVAEILAKDPEKGKAYRHEGDAASSADFTGLECRWEPIPAKRGEMLSVLIKVREPTERPEQEIYREIIQSLDEILGKSKYDRLPLAKELMKLVSSPAGILPEMKIKTQGRSWFYKVGFFLWAYFAALLGRYWIQNRKQAAGTDWGEYHDEVIANSDFWKYDEMLRFVADVSAEQKQNLLKALAEREGRGQIFYGVHSSRSALMTCMVNNRKGDHVHFIDGGDGGYAMAAKQLKSQIKLQTKLAEQ